MSKMKFCQSCGMMFDEAHRKFIAKEKGMHSEIAFRLQVRRTYRQSFVRVHLKVQKRY